MSIDTENSAPTTGDPVERFTDIHPRSPLYLHPSNIPVCILIPQQLTGIENYTAWSNSMKVALYNAFVLSWITNSVSRELGNGLVYSSNAHKVWMDLKERFDKRNLTQVYQLHTEIYTMTQGTSTIFDYFSKLRNVWDEYLSLVPLPGSDKAYANYMEQQKLMQFLMGLNETYAQSCNQILMTVPSPSLNQAYNMLMQDEIQRM
ncbi:uncharacterized protein LOC142180887 [Nicotiana tabacum]|uniref:Uncharacterized protein LOC142180887 n=1 Tax=Nicotiana tabacum TaxID=4097 RepID=A0AC58UHZ3_TOBAC